MRLTSGHKIFFCQLISSSSRDEFYLLTARVILIKKIGFFCSKLCVLSLFRLTAKYFYIGKSEVMHCHEGPD